MHSRLIVAAAVSVIALSACQRQEEAPAAEDSVAPTPGAGAPAAPPTLQRKPGLWRMAMSMEGVDFVQTTRVCIDEATEREMSVWGAQTTRDMCSEHRVTRQRDGSWAFRSVYSMGSGGVTTTEGVATGDFQSRYQVRATTTTSGAATPQMNRSGTMTIQASWEGPCPEGWRPGDMEVPGGGRINLAR